MKSSVLINTVITFALLFYLVSCKGNSGGSIPTPYECGNSVLEVGEQCDDGNLTSGDGCDEACRNEINPDVSQTVNLGQLNCGETFSESGILYELTEDIACPGTAFAFTKGGIIFDGKDHKIIYGTAGGNNPGLAITEWNTQNTVFRNFRLNQHENTTGGNGIHSTYEPRYVRISNVSIEGGIGMTDWHTVSLNGCTGCQLIDVIAYSHSTDTGNRHQFSGRNISMGGSGVLLDRVIAVGGSQNAVVTGDDWLIRHSYLAAGGLKEDLSPIAKVSNDFAVTGWQVQGTDLVNIVVVNTHQNVTQHDIQDYITGSRTIDDLLIYHSDMNDSDKKPIALIPHQEGRGVGFGGTAPTDGLNVLDSVIYTENSATNEEYSGCSLGGAYALQLENTINTTIGRSVFVANAAECEANALRVGGASGTFTDTDIIGNTFIAEGGIEGEQYASVFRFAQGVGINISGNTAILKGLSRLFFMDGNYLDGLRFDSTNIDCSDYSSLGDKRLFGAMVWEDDSNVPKPNDIYFDNSTFADDDCETFIMNNHGFWNLWNGTAVDQVVAHFD